MTLRPHLISTCTLINLPTSKATGSKFFLSANSVLKQFLGRFDEGSGIVSKDEAGDNEANMNDNGPGWIASSLQLTG